MLRGVSDTFNPEENESLVEYAKEYMHVVFSSLLRKTPNLFLPVYFLLVEKDKFVLFPCFRNIGLFSQSWEATFYVPILDLNMEAFHKVCTTSPEYSKTYCGRYKYNMDNHPSSPHLSIFMSSIS